MSFTITNPTSGVENELTEATSSPSFATKSEILDEETEKQVQVDSSSTDDSNHQAAEPPAGLATSLLLGFRSLMSGIGRGVYGKASDPSKLFVPFAKKQEASVSNPETSNSTDQILSVEQEQIVADEQEEKLYHEKLEALQIFVDPLSNVLHFLEAHSTKPPPVPVPDPQENCQNRSLVPLYMLKEIITSSKKVPLNLLDKCEKNLQFLHHGEGLRFWPAKLENRAENQTDLIDDGSIHQQTSTKITQKEDFDAEVEKVSDTAPTKGVNLDKLWSQIWASNHPISEEQERILNLTYSLE